MGTGIFMCPDKHDFDQFDSNPNLVGNHSKSAIDQLGNLVGTNPESSRDAAHPNNSGLSCWACRSVETDR